MSGVRDPSPTPDYPAQGSSTRKISPKTSGCKNQWGLEQWRKLWESQAFPLKGPTTDLGLLRLTPSGLQHRGSSWKDTCSIQGGTEVSGIGASARRQLPPGQNSKGQAAAIVPFLSLPTHRAAYLHQPGSHRLLCPGNCLSLFPIQLNGVHHHQAIIICSGKGTYLRKRSKLLTLKW